MQQFRNILLQHLRIIDETIDLRNGLINRINGTINMTFSCEGSHYIDHMILFEKLEYFECFRKVLTSRLAWPNTESFQEDCFHAVRGDCRRVK